MGFQILNGMEDTMEEEHKQYQERLEFKQNQIILANTQP